MISRIPCWQQDIPFEYSACVLDSAMHAVEHPCKVLSEVGRRKLGKHNARIVVFMKMLFKISTQVLGTYDIISRCETFFPPIVQ